MGFKRTRDRDHEHDRRSVRHKPSRLLSLDAIAARTERPVLLPRSPPQCLSSSPAPAPASARPHTPEPLSEDEPGGRALWENMQSSPAAPEPAKRTEKDLVRYGRRKYTLEYACAREMVGGKKVAVGKEKKAGRSGASAKPGQRKGGLLPAVGKGLDVRVEGPREREDDQEVPVLEWDADMHGDTDTEGVPSEAVTPSSSFGIGGLSVADDCEKENVAAAAERAADDALKRKMEEAQASTRSDADLMDVAYVLCGLSQRC
ncbi:hypothetical protein TRAPUB_4820 [Trametes pubescens]|uniref:Uncharacterized protein n=1 Tax=Trametes pubescens TaxID=154538 RepID=A0A1M2VA70_TRAPU|nr:hypothetical protein TRAPUB_4820 [Trametes pubescens]